jgi:hypothetical protein
VGARPARPEAVHFEHFEFDRTQKTLFLSAKQFVSNAQMLKLLYDKMLFSSS